MQLLLVLKAQKASLNKGSTAAYHPIFFGRAKVMQKSLKLDPYV